MNKEKNMLMINQLAKVCNTSRSALLRMEQDGILTPAYTDPNSGYRYYDETNVIRVNRILSMQEFGITHKELSAYYSSPTNYQLLYESLAKKKEIMEYHLANLSPILFQEPHFFVSNFYYPDMYCYIKTLRNVKDLSTISPELWKAFNEVIQHGYVLDRRVSPFVRFDFIKAQKYNFQHSASEFDFDLCFPVCPDSHSDSLEYFPSCNSISVSLYGGSKDFVSAFTKISEELTKQNLTPRGDARVFSIVHSSPGEDIPSEYWVSKACVPI